MTIKQRIEESGIHSGGLGILSAHQIRAAGGTLEAEKHFDSPNLKP